MLWVNLLVVLLPLLTENVQAADSYLTRRNNWNLRRPIVLESRPNPVVNPTHEIPKPLPKPIEVFRIHEVVHEPQYALASEVEENAPENNVPSTAPPSYRVLPQRRPLLAHTSSKPNPPTTVIIATEPTPIKEVVTEPTTIQEVPVYSSPPEATTSSDDIQIRPTLRRGMVPRPLPRPERIVLNRPQPVIETTTTPAPLPTVEAVKVIPVTVVLPEVTTSTLPPTTTTELPTTKLLPIPEPEPEQPKLVIIKNVPKSEPEIVEPVEEIEIVPETEEPIPTEDLIVEEETIQPITGYSRVRNTRPLSPSIRRPNYSKRPFRVPRPVVTPRPIFPKPIPTLPTLPPPTLKPVPPKVVEPRPSGKFVIPSNPGSEWITPAPTQLMDYQCREADGYYSIPGDCDNYVECRKFVAIMYTCPDGLHYNPRARWPEYPCGYPSEVKCDSNSVTQLARPTKECPQQYGFYPMADSDCSRYIMCQEGKAFVMNCPPGLVFNAPSSSCDWPENVPACRPEVFRGFTCPAVSAEENDMIFKYRYKESCKEYIACQRGHPRLLRCDPGLAFDEQSEVCVDSDYVSNCRY